MAWNQRLMRTAALEASAELGLELELEEINDTARLSRSSSLDLPRLVANGGGDRLS